MYSQKKKSLPSISSISFSCAVCPRGYYCQPEPERLNAIAHTPVLRDILTPPFRLYQSPARQQLFVRDFVA